MEVLHFLETVAVIMVMFMVNFLWWGQDGELYIDKEEDLNLFVSGCQVGFQA